MRRNLLCTVLFVAVFAAAGLGRDARAQSVLDTPAKYGLESEPSGLTDHELVIGAFGFQVISTQLDSLVDLNLIGVRYWILKNVGLDIGGGVLLHQPRGDADFQAGVAVAVGVPLAVKAYKHLCLYIEPKLDFGLWRPMEDSTPWRFDLGGFVGAEVSLGWIGIPRLSFLAELGAGLTVVNDGDESDVSFGTKVGHTFPWMFDGNVGVVYYF
jgi:hypothetical protein